MQQFDVLTVGTANRDVYLASPFFKVLKDPEHLQKIGFIEGEAQCFALGAKIYVDKPLFLIGGGAANTAMTFSRQGFKTAAAVSLGADANGEAVIEGLKKEKVAAFASINKKDFTGYSTVLLSESGERTILVSHGAANDFKRSAIPSDLTARWVYLNPGALDVGMIKAIATTFKKHGSRIALNPSAHYLKMGIHRLQGLFNVCDVVIMNREEAALITGVSYDNERGIFKKIDEWVKGIIVMTEGAKGVLVSDGKTIFRAETFKEEKLVDRLGAGDAFGSGFVSGLLHAQPRKDAGWKPGVKDIEFAIRLAAANATAKVEAIGAQTGLLTKKKFLADKRWKHLPIRRTLAE